MLGRFTETSLRDLLLSVRDLILSLRNLVLSLPDLMSSLGEGVDEELDAQIGRESSVCFSHFLFPLLL